MPVVLPPEARYTPSRLEPNSTTIGALALSASVLPAAGSVVAMNAQAGHGRHRHHDELSIVTVFDGKIGDPVTWAEEWRTSRGASHAPRAAILARVADDIHAHLGNGPVVVHNAVEVLGLLGRVLPHWRPTLVLDMRLLYPESEAASARQPTYIGPQLERSLAPSLRRDGSADQALAIAHQFVRMTSAWQNRQP